jgi:hypothetical protein
LSDALIEKSFNCHLALVLGDPNGCVEISVEGILRISMTNKLEIQNK